MEITLSVSGFKQLYLKTINDFINKEYTKYLRNEDIKIEQTKSLSWNSPNQKRF